MRDLAEGLLDPIPVLDHGFVRLVDCMPRAVEEDGETADHAIARAARVSYQAGTRTSRSDRGLIRYLMRHWHTSPFEMVELKFHAKMPMFVARQWVRHRTASINEISARYSVLPEEVYRPEPGDIRPQSTTNRQGRGDEALDAECTERSLASMDRVAEGAFGAYRSMLEDNVARETARGVLPVNTYTEWYWKANLLNVMRFLQLRLDPHAQMEIRVYAEAMGSLVARLAPWTWEAFEEYWRHGQRFSAPEWAAIVAELDEDALKRIEGRLVDVQSPGELREFSVRLRAAKPE
ncbi:MAG: FAD-dependent thymidylate synthase [Deltaproteobacteria bacterium]|nr:MAG: FAD-dependent thymidylate synthase [Deltaproteobacteria bacterium]